MRILAQSVLAAAIAFLACSGVRVTTDYDPGTDFTRVRTYAWLDDQSGVQGDRPDVTSLLDRRVRRAVDAELQRKGLSPVAQAEADALVSYHLGVETKLDVNTINTGYGYGWGAYRGGVATHTTVTEYQEGTLLIDLIDPKAKQLIWRGSGQSRLRRSSTPEQREQRIDEAVGEILKSFPPQPEKS
jgi:Domain of unknown function (DUF4136)